MDLSRMQEVLAGREKRPDQLIEVLQDMQAEFNYLPEEGLRLVAETLGVSPIEVFRVANFYKAFSLTPRLATFGERHAWPMSPRQSWGSLRERPARMGYSRWSE